MRMSLRTLLALLAGVGAAGPAFAGPDWVEIGDAGPTLATAQPVLGVNQLSHIVGSLSTGIATADSEGGGDLLAPDYEDLYLVRIQVPTMFSFQVGGTAFNAQLFLFNITLPGEAFGLLANDDTLLSNAPLLTSPATDATGAQVLLPGVYALGVTGYGHVPVSVTGPIFAFASTTEISGADGPGGLNPLSGWSGIGETGDYRIALQGIDWVDIPGPTGAAWVSVFGGLLLRRRSR